MTDKVSILTSVYNKAPWLERWFNAVESQTYQNLEIVVVDNASTDESGEIIDRHASKDERIKVIRVDVNRGPSGGYNLALKNATGKWFTFIDSDDTVDDSYIEVLLNAAIKYKADVAMCLNDIVYPDGKTIHKPWPREGEYLIKDNDLLRCQLLDELSSSYFGYNMPEAGAVWIKLARTDIALDNRIYFNENLWTWTDFDFWLRYFSHINSLIYTTGTKYHFFQSYNSVTRENNYNKEFVRRILLAIDAIDHDVKDNHDILQEAANAFIANRFLECINYLYYNRMALTRKEMSSLFNLLLSDTAVKRLAETYEPAFKDAIDNLFYRLAIKGHFHLYMSIKSFYEKHYETILSAWKMWRKI